MNNFRPRTLTCAVLLCASFCALASSASPVSPGQAAAGDVQWMKQQQRELEAFKASLSGGSVTLPDAQQHQVENYQSQIDASLTPASGAEKETLPAVYFVSLSIPKEGLKPMLNDARRFGIPATLRGLKENDFRKTAAAVYDLAKEDNNAGVQIDPTLFERYDVRAVPALVVTCPGHYDIVRGSLQIEDALKEIVRRGDCADAARRLLEAAR